MPFGLKNAGTTYQRAMTIVLDGLLYEIIECYIDDIIVKSKQEKDHLKHLAIVFERLRKHKLKMNPMKCAFGVSSGKFLGFIVTKRGIQIDPTKIKAINRMPCLWGVSPDEHSNSNERPGNRVVNVLSPRYVPSMNITQGIYRWRYTFNVQLLYCTPTMVIFLEYS